MLSATSEPAQATLAAANGETAWLDLDPDALGELELAAVTYAQPHGLR